jgi:N6-L-threonylcarbamoyladenine synthase
MRVLGIETSCDETAAAVVQDDGSVLSDVVHSQVSVHAPYGGVVPELASRDHLRNIQPVVDAAISRAGLTLHDLDGIAVTCRPGLTGALLVGVQMAQGLAWALDKPLVGVDHLVGHLLAVFLKHPGAPAIDPPPSYPFVALLASGGHTAIYRVAGPELDQVTELGATRDDAAGEAYDKVAKLLALGYPGGPIVDRLAQKGNPDAVTLSMPMSNKSSLEFSFSGLKTNVVRWVESNGRPTDEVGISNLCAAFQRTVVKTLVGKSLRACKSSGISTLVLGGGVAANSALRETARREGERVGVRVIVPPFKSCTDNAAMIAYAAMARLAKGDDDRGRLEVSPRTSLPRATRKGKGRRTGARAGSDPKSALS